jgi:hypothetical protein
MLSAIIANALPSKYTRAPGCRSAAKDFWGAFLPIGVPEVIVIFLNLSISLVRPVYAAILKPLLRRIVH